MNAQRLPVRPFPYVSGEVHPPDLLPPFVERYLFAKSPSHLRRAGQCAQTLTEQLCILRARYVRAFDCAQALSSGFHEVFQFGGVDVSTNDLQFAFVDAAESFYQSVYPTLAWLGKLLELVAPHGTFRGVPLGSVSGLINGMAKFEADADLCAVVDVLKRVNDFRNAFLVHPRVDRPWSWMTSVNEGRPLVAYFFLPNAPCKGLRTASGRIRLHRDSPSFEPWSPDFTIPVDNDGFVIPPYVPVVLLSVLGLINTTMRHVHRSIEESVVEWPASQMLILRAFPTTFGKSQGPIWREDTRSWWSWMQAAPAALVSPPPEDLHLSGTR